jgi:hypothetical protein
MVDICSDTNLTKMLELSENQLMGNLTKMMGSIFKDEVNCAPENNSKLQSLFSFPNSIPQNQYKFRITSNNFIIIRIISTNLNLMMTPNK